MRSSRWAAFRAAVSGVKDFNRTIIIPERERKRVMVFIDAIGPNEKTIVFCATQEHALMIRDMINQVKKVPDANYCHRVTANDGALYQPMADGKK